MSLGVRGPAVLFCSMGFLKFEAGGQSSTHQRQDEDTAGLSKSQLSTQCPVVARLVQGLDV